MLNMHWVSHPTLFCEQTTQGLDKVIIAADVIQGMIKYVLILLSCDDQKLTSGPPTSSYTNDFKHTYFHPPIMNFGCLPFLGVALLSNERLVRAVLLTPEQHTRIN